MAFALRTILVMIVDKITRASPITLAKMNATYLPSSTLSTSTKVYRFSNGYSHPSESTQHPLNQRRYNYDVRGLLKRYETGWSHIFN